MPKIIISYRRADSSAISGRIRDRLAQNYGAQSVFMDIDNIPFGTDFRKHIADALRKQDLLLVVVGPGWLGASGNGASRIHEVNDPVRIEVETALKRGMPVIPVLVGGASMPQTDALPDSLKDFSFLNAAEVDDGRDFHPHMDRLIRSIDQILKIRPGLVWNPSRWAAVSAAAAAGVAVIAIATFFVARQERAPSAGNAGAAQAGAAAPVSAPPPASTGIANLLTPEHGVRVVAAPHESWRKTVSGNEADSVDAKTGADAVYAFKDNKPA